MSLATRTWRDLNPSWLRCAVCGVRTNGWGGTPGTVPERGGTQYALCRGCGGKCCGDCKPGECEFGFEGGGPTAVDRGEWSGKDDA